jgi:GTP-binding protein
VKFVDSCEIRVIAGNGGNGSVAFRREKFVPFGGPSGGDGGRGGDVIFETDPGMSTLLDLSHARTLRAADGENGQGSDCYGRAGKDLVVRVPVGTQVIDAITGTHLFDLTADNTRTVIARGGRGGRGNIHFSTPQDRAPRRAEPGGEGQDRALRLELKVMADVGLLGFPNAGKSTFIRACSQARPKVADYPFTTLVPHLGVVQIDDEPAFVLADIPGLIPGAAEGAGLGIRFLKHVERTRALLHLITLDFDPARDPLADYEALRAELQAFDPALAQRPTLVAFSKADLPECREAYEKLVKVFAKKKIQLHLVSAVTGEGMLPLLRALRRLVHEGPTMVEAEHQDVPAPARPAAQKATTRRAPRKDTASKESASKRTVANKIIAGAAKRATAKNAAAKKAAGKKAASASGKGSSSAGRKLTRPKPKATAKGTPRKTGAKKTGAKKTSTKKTQPKSKPRRR